MTESHMPTISSLACWLAIIASFVLSFSTWLALGVLAGFGALAVAMPFCVDGYTVTALTTWLLPGVSDRLAKFARNNLYSVGVLGMLSQGSYHAWLAATSPGASQGKTALAFAVGLFPMAIATLAVHLKARAIREAEQPQPEPAGQPELATTWASAEREWPERFQPPRPVQAQPAPELPEKPATQSALSTTPSSQGVTGAAWQPAVPPSSPEPDTEQPPPAPPQPAKLSLVAPVKKRRATKVEESGSGPLTKGAPSIDDVRPLVNAGLGRNAIAERLGIGTGVARRLIDAVNAESADRPAVTS